jgi:hypothetical protein
MVIKKNWVFDFREEGREDMAEEALGWIFVDFVPLLYDKKKVARQLQVETWLDLSQLVKELGIEKPKNNQTSRPANGYVV